METAVTDAAAMLGRKLLVCGNGGSAGQAQRFAVELALGQPGDGLVALSTSGNSENAASLELIVAHQDTARVPEAHQFFIHAIMDGIEESLAPQKADATSAPLQM